MTAGMPSKTSKRRLPSLTVPKDIKRNLEFRHKLLEAAATSTKLKQDIWIACARDFAFWVNVVGWTYNPKEFPDHPDRPFILYDYQEQESARVDKAIGRHDLLGEKSRDMGFTWYILAKLLHRWQFKKGQSFLIASRKESYVDETGNSDSLFWKLDYLLSHQPIWMQPAVTRNIMHLSNDENGSTFDGESTNKDLGRGGRRTAIMLDEFAAVENGEKILKSTRDITNCRIFGSTPQGAAGAFYDQRMKFKAENPDWIIRWHWTTHPHKAKGLYFVDGKPRSPWYDEQCKRAAHPQEIAQELDIAYEESGWQFFEQTVLERLVKEKCYDPIAEGELEYGLDLVGTFRKLGRGHLKLWIALDTEGSPPKGNYGIGFDIATGKGGEYSSQSVASVIDRDSGRKVAQFNSNKIDEREFARFGVSLARFFHNAKMIWEANGPGQAFGKAIYDTTTYRNCWLRQDEQKLTRDVKMVAGWWSDRDTKYQLLTEYRESLTHGKFINPCREAVLECGQYVMQANREVAHARSLNTSDPTATGQLHGDMVIADAVANKLLTTQEVEGQTIKKTTPANCLAGRFDTFQRQQREARFVFKSR